MDRERQQELREKDRQYVWHPFTQMKDYAAQDHVLIEKADGIMLYDADGKSYYDTISSWWCNVHGHGNPRIKEAIRRQLEQFDHIMFSGLTHQPGIELAEQLVQVTPDGLTKVFYSDNGSTAVEVAIKMSFQYWQQIGQQSKTNFVFMENSYHGDTIGAVSVGGVDLYHAMFKPLLFNAIRVPSPDVRQLGNERTPEREAALVADALDAVRTLFRERAHELAGIIVEPMIQAAGGMVIYPAAYLRGLRELCAQFNVHLIADEVATGFGRTGRMFACEHAGISPDILCLSKGLTAGMMPLAATLCREEIYAAFYDDYATQKTFFHGHSFTGNPVACAVALESLRLFRDEAVLEQSQAAANTLTEQMNTFTSLPHVADVRQLGMIAALDLYRDPETRTPFASDLRIGTRMYHAGLAEGLILRPLGDTIYYWLPLCTTPSQIEDIVERTQRVLRQVTAPLS
ncbi:adenosylmethionine--8-amino-7-oxononanoate transaminase [Paenibacillus selenitireducens]|uniref:Adenosylmethionine-8-amino-7-oxononanoate aminotransferase n=1 Tax=Paenibacillus selenitireducens TaxID=1324314 RepID=A0A1T2X7A3_9BACL|nr:adenosylmethionine--8-amino-7-oxononanoate transaminase [Paenibacillus selenitireducens]OPA75566.1 adenosylmethionine--8-amino-7-oxononanoate transaminase [Paenibacillus selenitireducens]